MLSYIQSVIPSFFFSNDIFNTISRILFYFLNLFLLNFQVKRKSIYRLNRWILLQINVYFFYKGHLLLIFVLDGIRVLILKLFYLLVCCAVVVFWWVGKR